MSETCPHCGAIMIKTGGPIWEIYCETPECADRNRKQFWDGVKAAIERDERAELSRLKQKYERDGQ